MVDDQESPATALLVITDPTLCEIYMRTLAMAGYSQVTTARSLDDARRALDSPAPPALVATTLQFSMGDCFQLIEELGARRFAGRLVLLSDAPAGLAEAAIDLAEHHGITVVGSFESPFSVRALLRALGERPSPVPLQQRQFEPGEGEVDEALRDGRIQAVFQPKVSLRDGSYVGFEALARWNHPQAGMLGPASFISRAESGIAIHELTEVIFRQSLDVLARCRRFSPTSHGSINLSGVSLGSSDLPQRMQSIAADAGMPHDAVIFEVTETQMLVDINHAISNVNRLRLLGFGLSLDDYGTGFSSLTRLKSLPFSELKVDREFVHGASSRRSLAQILGNCLQLGRSLNLKVVAEGVETRDDYELVRDMGFDVVQGFYTGAPMSADKLLDWLEKAG